MTRLSADAAYVLDEIIPLVPFELIELVARHRSSTVLSPAEREEGVVRAYVGADPYMVVLVNATVGGGLGTGFGCRDSRTALFARHFAQWTPPAPTGWTLAGSTPGGRFEGDGGELCWAMLRLVPPDAWVDITSRCLASVVTAPSADRLGGAP